MKPDYQIKNVKLYNVDCMEFMKDIPGNYYDLAIVDPPYAVEEITGKEFSHGRGKLKNRAFNQGNKKINKWDKKPTKEYFDELLRTSKNQIIWGGNYFDLPIYRCPIVWDKCQPFPNFSALELAWTSFNQPAKLFKFDNRTGGKIHPTQKPIQLYKWLLTNYANKGDKILDTHGGSFSSACACLDMGFEFDGCEIDKEYFDNAVKRLKNNVQEYLKF